MTHPYKQAFSPFELGGFTLKNRIVMAPLTRQSALDDGTPTNEMAAYYARRARGGVSMVICEGTWQNDEFGCVGYLNQPGILTDSHIDGWRRVVEAVHRHDVPIVLQLMHAGRVADPRCLHRGESPVSASDGQSPGIVLYTDSDDEKLDRGITGAWPVVGFPPARALTVAEIERIADGFAEGAARAVEAGFDGVEIHGANGYLLYQFIHPDTNQRSDNFGGSAENNVRFAKLACDRVRQAIGPDKLITLRLSQDGVDDFTGRWPGGVSYAREVGAALADSAADALHWSSFAWSDNRDPDDATPMPTAIREASGKPMIVNGGIAEGEHAETVVASSAGDLCAIGRPIFAHPDWPYIVRAGEAYDWVPFDRKHVIKPSYDYAFGYPLDLKVSEWNPDLEARRDPGWLED